jgi:alkylation response protein AidB-like acyl-CoA dehydrogenase
VGITTELIAPTIRTWGDESQKERYLRPMLRGDELWCQLMSEPTAGSDVGGLRTRAVRDGEVWTVNGQKVWTSGARHAQWGYLLARSDPDAPKHQGITAFIVPMDASGVEVRPIRQMSGGASFNEVFFTDVRLADSMRLGPENSGWRVAMTTLGFERVAGSGEGNDLLARFDKAMALSKQLRRSQDPVVRQYLARSYTLARLSELNNERVRQAWLSGATPGPEGSIGKLFHGLGLAQFSEMISVLLGPRLMADSGEHGTYQWSEHVTGAPGSRIAGGTDEIQRNVLAERILGLPREPPMTPPQS